MEKELFKKMELQLFAEDGAGDNAETGAENNANNEAEQGTDDNSIQGEKEKQEQQNNEPKGEKLFTQKQVDKIIQERLKRASKGEDSASNQTAEQAQELQSLKEQMEDAISENYALKQGVQDDKLSYVIKLAKAADGDDYKGRIDKVLEEFPFLIAKKADPGEAGEKVSNAIKASIGKSGNTGKKMTKEEILSIQDGTKRRKAIAENIDLFK